MASDDAERASRQARLQQTEAVFDPLPFAAITLANDLPVYTCNPSDFDGIEGLRVEGIRHPDAGS